MTSEIVDAFLPKFSVKWNGNEYPIEGLDKTNTIYDLKEKIECLTNVLVERQKLLGLTHKGWIFLK